jgi:hypothetical protein
MRKLPGLFGFAALVLVMLWALPTWIRWESAMDVSEAERLYHRRFPSGWQAVNVDHGVFSKHEWGRPADHPVAFSALTILAFGPAVLVFAAGFREGYRRTRADQTTQPGRSPPR